MEGKTILIVDDHPDNRELLAVLLRHLGCTVLTANDGAEGVRFARAHRPDLILMDISMPVIDGFEAAELLKVYPKTRDIPLLALSAHDDARFRARALGAGFTGYVTKPARPRDLLREIERCIGFAVPSAAPSPPPEPSARLDGLPPAGTHFRRSASDARRKDRVS